MMVLPTCLKRRHNLRDGRIFPVLKIIKNGSIPKDFARISKDRQTEKMTMPELETVVKDLTGEDLDDVLCHAGRGKTIEEGRLALHYIILAAQGAGLDNSNYRPI